MSTTPRWSIPAWRASAPALPALHELYHENSKLFPELARELARSFSGADDAAARLTGRAFRQYPRAEAVPLPDADVPSTALADVLLARRSRRELSAPIGLGDLGVLLRLALGPSAVIEDEEGLPVQALRTWPSGGGLYPIEAYVVAQRVEGLDPGVYHFNPIAEALERLAPAGDVDAVLRDGFFWQDFLVDASAIVVLGAVFHRTVSKYGERGYRLVLLDAGHVGQNLVLVAELLGLPSLPISGYCDDALGEALGLDGVDEAVVHTVALGGRP
ncbi:MAG: SagB/ThcOx family dehydrogenase [Dehalococcoidia bacterium]|nr:SagB/ThcOx family dehydrogenase [Dehalococcoidia bacterium]